MESLLELAVVLDDGGQGLLELPLFVGQRGSLGLQLFESLLLVLALLLLLGAVLGLDLRLELLEFPHLDGSFVEQVGAQSLQRLEDLLLLDLVAGLGVGQIADVAHSGLDGDYFSPLMRPPQHYEQTAFAHTRQWCCRNVVVKVRKHTVQ